MTFVGVAGRDEIEPVNRFIDGYGVSGFDHVFDDSLDVWRAFEVTSQPAWVFIGADGTAETHIGSLGEDGLSDRLDALTLG